MRTADEEVNMISFWPYFHSVGVALHWYRKGHGIKSRTGLNFFSGLIFTTA